MSAFVGQQVLAAVVIGAKYGRHFRPANSSTSENGAQVEDLQRGWVQLIQGLIVRIASHRPKRDATVAAGGRGVARAAGVRNPPASVKRW
jgi:hypothetical protein